MAVYKIFPEQDTFILSKYPAQNTGRDSILEVANVNAINLDTSAQGDLPAVKRSLVQFSTTDINDVVDNKISGSAFRSNLKLYLAEATVASQEYIIEAYPISGSWNMGTGKFSDSPKTENGCSWTWRATSGSLAWSTSGFEDYITASFSGSIPGGGTWYTGSEVGDPSATQTFTYTSNKDISMNVTTAVQLWNSGSLPNHGFIIKLDDSIEFTDTYVQTSFFSVDTHTIYPPELEFKWDDSSYSTTLTAVTSSDFILAFTNLKQEFEDSGIYNFKLKVRDKYPTRAFQTSSVYLDAKVLPTSSYWGLKDSKTGEMVVDFDTSYTKISADNNGNYFKVYMDGLEPERYYQLVVKTIVEDETLVIEDKGNYFKVVR